MTAPARTHLGGIVLAGGRSSRMGSEKAALVHPDGRTLLRRTCELLAAAGCDPVVISLRHGQEIPADAADFTIVRDPVGADTGPIAGMLAGIRLDPAKNWIVTACDLPNLDRETLEILIASKRPGESFLAYRSETDGLPEPLCALYSSGSIPVLEDALANDFRCPRKILIRNDCRLLDPVSPGALANANTPDEWQAATRP